MDGLKAVILDWAGTTLDYGCMAPMVVFREVYAHKGVPISEKEARLPMGAHKRVHIQKIGQIPEVKQRWLEVHGVEQTEKDIDEMFEAFQPLQLPYLVEYSPLIPGTLETIAYSRDKGMKIGSTTGYTGEMMDILMREGLKQGYIPDSSVTATGHVTINDLRFPTPIYQDLGFKYSKSHIGIPEGRPGPWMCTLNAMLLNVYPPHLCVKVDDTIPGIEEGVNAGMWTIGLAKSGNEIGKPLEEVEKMDKLELESKLDDVHIRMYKAGADFVVDTIADISPVLDEINYKLKRGQRPNHFLPDTYYFNLPP